jgi:LytR cell envelope-related transcriptional attenuator
MATIPFALSISHLVSSAGADVGFAAILGLAILVLLFFSQARETATLRRRADEAEQQLRDLAAYVEQLLRRPTAQPTEAPATGAVAPPPAAARVAARQAAFPAAGRPAPAPAAATVGAAAASATAVATIPAAPAGVAAPALSSATRLIPLPAADPISIRALKNGNGDGEHHQAEAAAPAAAVAAPVAAPSAPAGPPPSTAAGGANGTGRVAAAPPPAAAPPTASEPPAPPRPPQRPAGRPGGPPAFNDPVPPSHPRVSRMALIAASIVAVIVVIVAVLVLLNRGSGGSPQTAGTSSPSAAASRRAGRSHHSAATIAPSTVTVAVLNGTTTSHLAADVMSRLTSAGYKPGAKTNAPAQTVTSTIVGYTQPSDKADALAVARSLKLGTGAVRAVSQGDLAAACPGAGTGCPDQVVVTLGSDLSSAASTATSAATP